MSSSDLVTLAQMDGEMQWLAGYGNLTSEKTYRLPTKAAIVYMIAEAAREKINHFLRKFILFFVSLFVTLFHFLKSDVTVAFYFTNYI